MNALALMLVVTLSPYVQPGVTKSAASPATQEEASKWAQLGEQLLQANDVAQARPLCEKSLQLDLANADGLTCLKSVISAEKAAKASQEKEQVVAQIAEARARLSIQQYDQAIALLSKTLVLAHQDKMSAEEADIKSLLKEDARPTVREEFKRKISSGWTSTVTLWTVALALIYLFLQIARLLYRKALESQWRLFGHVLSRRKWSLLPVDDKDGLGITEGLFQALKTLPLELQSPVEIPTILPLRPLKGEPYEPEVWKDYQVDPPRMVKDFENIAFDLNLHEFALADAAREMQFKFAGIEFGGLTSLSRGVWKWFNTGAPTITGSATVSDLADKKQVTIRLTLTEGKNFASVVASTTHQGAVEAAELATERAAYKLLYLVTQPECRSIDVDAFAARRQGIKLLKQHVSSGRASSDRAPALTQALENFAFARGVLSKRDIASELHLFEGITATLLDMTDVAEQHFRTVRDLGSPTSPEEALLCLQAIYNCAVILQRKGEIENLSQSIGMYERVIDSQTRLKALESWSNATPTQKTGQAALQTLSSFGKLTAAALYLEKDSRNLVSPSVTEQWIKEAQQFLTNIIRPAANGEGSVSGNSISEFIWTEANRSFASLGDSFFEHFTHWPSADSQGNSSAETLELLGLVQRSLGAIESRSVPDLDLYRKIVRVNIALGRFDLAKDPSCRAIGMGAADELFFYARTAAAIGENDMYGAFRAIEDYKGQVTLQEFKDLKARIGMKAIQPGLASPQAPVPVRMPSPSGVLPQSRPTED